MSDVFSTVLNDVAQKFMKNNQKIEQTDMKKGVKQEQSFISCAHTKRYFHTVHR